MSQERKKSVAPSRRPSAPHAAFCLGLALVVGSAIVPASAHGPQNNGSRNNGHHNNGSHNNGSHHGGSQHGGSHHGGSHDNGSRNKEPVVHTDKGSVRGYKDDGVYKFLGIPYAAPPVGHLRWRPPAPAKSWRETRDATQFGNTCPQVTGLGVFAGPTSITEDCLFLNVFTTGNSGRKKPVIVWIHGGANIDGESNDYDGSKLATGGPLGTSTVVVTINYRMGLFGILSQDDINAEGHTWGNYGLLDQQAALRWVRRNIAAFGGDPRNVTLGGQSAGAWDTSAQMISPGAEGLFHRAIIQSFPASTWTSAETALQRGNGFAAAAGCSNAACLRKLSAARILQLQGTPIGGGPYSNNIFIDGNIIPMQPQDAWASGAYHMMPVLAGSVKDENGFSLLISEYFTSPFKAWTVDQYEASNSAAVKAEYPLSDYGNNPSLAQIRIGSDGQYGGGQCTFLRMFKLMASTNSFPLYTYNFTYENAPSYFPQMPNPSDPTGVLRPLAYHTSDIQFVFPGYHGGHLGVNLDQLSGQPREIQGQEVNLSDRIVASWTKFAKTGNPNGYGNSPWPAFTTSSSQFLKQDIPMSILSEADYRAAYHCGFWDPQS
jgi:para-nitrobenzyl esterase